MQQRLFEHITTLPLWPATIRTTSRKVPFGCAQPAGFGRESPEYPKARSTTPERRRLTAITNAILASEDGRYDEDPLRTSVMATRSSMAPGVLAEAWSGSLPERGSVGPPFLTVQDPCRAWRAQTRPRPVVVEIRGPSPYLAVRALSVIGGIGISAPSSACCLHRSGGA